MVTAPIALQNWRATMFKKIRDLLSTDLVTDGHGKQSSFELTEEFQPDRMFRCSFLYPDGWIGYVDCTPEHMWTLVDPFSEFSHDVSTMELMIHVADKQTGLLSTDAPIVIGKPDGPILRKIIEIPPISAMCLNVLPDDGTEPTNTHPLVERELESSMSHSFEIIAVREGVSKSEFWEAEELGGALVDSGSLADHGRSILTHNCQSRFVAGKLEDIFTSRMALGDSSGLFIDGSRKGAGIVKDTGGKTSVQFYYAEPSAFKEWFADRGLDEFGYDPHVTREAESKAEMDIGTEDEDLRIDRDKFEIDFEDIHAEVDRTQDQKFEEV